MGSTWPPRRALLSDPVAGPAVGAFLRNTRQGYIASDGVCASVAAMPSDVAALQRLVDACVDCVHAVDSAREGMGYAPTLERKLA